MPKYSIAIANRKAQEFEDEVSKLYSYALDTTLIEFTGRPATYVKIYTVELTEEQYSFLALKFEFVKHRTKKLQSTL